MGIRRILHILLSYYSNACGWFMSEVYRITDLLAGFSIIPPFDGKNCFAAWKKVKGLRYILDESVLGVTIRSLCYI